MAYRVKPATTIEQHVAILKSRGLVIPNDATATAILHRFSCYRLSGYLVDYKRTDGTYIPGTQLSTIYAIYEFDRRFRNLLLGMIEPIEPTAPNASRDSERSRASFCGARRAPV